MPRDGTSFDATCRTERALRAAEAWSIAGRLRAAPLRAGRRGRAARDRAEVLAPSWVGGSAARHDERPAAADGLHGPRALAGGDGRSILLLHGKNFRSSTRAGPIAMAARRGFRVVVPDQIGFGKWAKPDLGCTFEKPDQLRAALLPSRQG